MSQRKESRPPRKTEAEIEVLVFDMGHVFVDFDWEEVCLGFCRRAEISMDEFKPILKHIASLGYETGHINTQGLLDQIQRVSQIKLAKDEFKDLWNATFRENDDMSALLQELKLNYPLYLLSNTNECHWQYLESNYRVSRHFDHLVLSYEVGLAKPDHRIYHEVVNKSGRRPESCLFIDDLKANVEAARAVGMQAIQFQNHGDLVSELAELGIVKDS